MNNDSQNSVDLNLQSVLNATSERLAASDLYYGHGTACAWDEAAYLVLAAMGLAATTKLSQAPQTLSLVQYQQLQAMLEQRIDKRVPTAYLTHESYFAGLAFYVNAKVLIPRSPLAELILQGFAPWFEPDKVKRVLEIGTGSGCIAIAIAHYLSHCNVDATDIDADALAIAAKNVTAHSLDKRITLWQSDVYQALPVQQYDIIISNPPYVDAADMANLPAEYQHEPQHALAAGDDGLAIVHRLIADAARYLTPHGILIVEVGNSWQALEQAYPQTAFTWLEFAEGGDGVFMLSKQDLLSLESK